MIDDILRELSFPPHVRAALDEGKLWRAREILQGRVGTMPYSPELYEQYGALLLVMKDDMQAGKYLFLSGVRRAAYEKAIALFLARHPVAGGRGFIASFPAKVRALPPAKLPAEVRRELGTRGLGDRPNRPLEQPPLERSQIAPLLATIGCLIAGGITLASFVVGLPIVFDWLFRLF